MKERIELLKRRAYCNSFLSNYEKCEQDIIEAMNYSLDNQLLETDLQTINKLMRCKNSGKTR